MLSLTVVVFPTSPSSVTTGMSLSIPSCLPRLIVTVRHQVDESRATISAGTNLKTRALAIIERVTQPIHFVLDIAQRLVRRLERAVLHLQRSIFALQFFE